MDKIVTAGTGKVRQLYLQSEMHLTPSLISFAIANFTFAKVNYTFVNANYTFAKANYTFAKANYTFVKANYTFVNVNYTLAKANYTFVNVNYTLAKANYTFVNVNFTTTIANFHTYDVSFESESPPRGAELKSLVSFPIVTHCRTEGIEIDNQPSEPSIILTMKSAFTAIVFLLAASVVRTEEPPMAQPASTVETSSESAQNGAPSILESLPKDIRAAVAQSPADSKLREAIKNIDTGDADSMFRMSQYIISKSEAEDRFMIALDLLEHADRKGNLDATLYLCGFYKRDNPGIARDYAKALSYGEKAYNGGECIAALQMVAFYQFGLDVPVDVATAYQWIQRLEKCDTPLSWNNIAWFYATVNDPLYRNPEKAVSYANKAVKASDYDYGYLDTLAAAYATAGNFKQAVVAQKLAISRIDTFDPSHEILIKEFETRLKLYQAGGTYTEKSYPPF